MTKPNPFRDPLTGMAALYYGQKRGSTLTPLNKATTARYQSCEQSGGHKPGRTSVYRTLPKSKGEDVKMPICTACGVPVVPARIRSVWSLRGSPVFDEDEAA